MAGCTGLAHLQDIPNTDMQNDIFQPEDAAWVFNTGTANISGKMFSGTIPAEFARVRLIPVTPYSTKVLTFLFDGSKAYFKGKYVDNVDPRYEKNMRWTQADSNGDFKFHTIPSGKFYLYGTIANYKKGINFAHMEAIQVADGQQLRIDLDGV